MTTADDFTLSHVKPALTDRHMTASVLSVCLIKYDKSTQVKRHPACGRLDTRDPLRATGVQYWMNRERVWCICWSVYGTNR